MCLLCDDEKAYKAYMDFLDVMERKGKVADPNEAIDAVLDHLEALDAERAKDNSKDNSKANKARLDDPANDKTLSPFFCSPINK